jgi:hypothetical protein
VHLDAAVPGVFSQPVMFAREHEHFSWHADGMEGAVEQVVLTSGDAMIVQAENDVVRRFSPRALFIAFSVDRGL